jgi:hypothetical protein
MNLTKNHKILLGIAIGGGLAYILWRRNKAGQGMTTASTGVVDAENPTTREGKIEYILANADADSQEEMTGFDGDRFSYNPTLGYELPHGEVDVTNAGSEMILPREGNLAQEVFFNAEGDPTDDPTAEAEAVLNELTNNELNVAFKVTKAKKENPNVSETALANRFGAKAKSIFENIVNKKLKDVKALKKSPKWKSKWEARKQKFADKIAGHEGRGKSAEAFGRKLDRMEQRGEKFIDRLTGKDRKKDFADQVTNRKDGAMWGGHRNDGQSTNAGDKPRRGSKPNERRA